MINSDCVLLCITGAVPVPVQGHAEPGGLQGVGAHQHHVHGTHRRHGAGGRIGPGQEHGVSGLRRPHHTEGLQGRHSIYEENNRKTNCRRTSGGGTKKLL